MVGSSCPTLLFLISLLLLSRSIHCENKKSILEPATDDRSASRNVNFSDHILPKTVCLDIDIADSTNNNNDNGSNSLDDAKVFVKVVNFDNITICEKVILEREKHLSCQVPLDYVSEGHNVFYASLYDINTGEEVSRLDSTFFISNDAEVTQWKRTRRSDLLGRIKRLEFMKKITASLALLTAATVVYLWVTQKDASTINSALTESNNDDNDDAFFRPPKRRWFGGKFSGSTSLGEKLKHRSTVKAGLGALVGVVGIGLALASSQGGLKFGGLKTSVSSAAIGSSATQPPQLQTQQPATIVVPAPIQSSSKISLSSIFRSIVESMSRRINKLWNDFLDD